MPLLIGWMPDKPKLGPTGQFPLGAPGFVGDRGGIHVAFRVLKPMRQCALEFGTTLNHLSGLPHELGPAAQTMRTQITKAFGRLTYNKAELPIRVWAEPAKGLIHINFPQMTSVLVANPEVFLALAERMEEEMAKLPSVT